MSFQKLEEKRLAVNRKEQDSWEQYWETRYGLSCPRGVISQLASFSVRMQKLQQSMAEKDAALGRQVCRRGGCVEFAELEAENAHFRKALERIAGPLDEADVQAAPIMAKLALKNRD